MAKVALKPNNYLYPMPTVIVGVHVNGKPNYITIAYCGICNHEPPMIAITSSTSHYSNAGIKENRSFSVNIPSEAQVAATDYVGIYSGKKVDKSGVFEPFYGSLATAPMIKECPINLECRLAQVVEVGGSHEMFLGEIVGAYADEGCLTGGVPDIAKIKPILFAMYADSYWKIGEYLGAAWEIGKDFNPEE